MIESLAKSLETLRQLIRDAKVNQFPSGVASPASDLGHVFPVLHSSPNASITVQMGVVHACNPATGVYQVVFGRETLPCVRLGENAHSLFGAYDASTLQPNTPVAFLLDASNPRMGWILGVLPPLGIDPKTGAKDCLGKGVGISHKMEPAYLAQLLLGPGPGDYSGRSLFNNLCIGEFCRVTETGLKLFLDPFMASMQTDETTGLWLFYLDQLCRLAGLNLQIWSSGCEFESLDDAGYHISYKGTALYPFEHRGFLTFEGISEGITENEAKVIQLQNPLVSSIEPKYGDIQSFHRLQTYSGFLGHVDRTFVVKPPEKDKEQLEGGGGITDSDIYRYSRNSVLPGQFDQVVSPFGTYGLKSATGIHFVKTSVLPVPKRKFTPADPSGNSPNGPYTMPLGLNSPEVEAGRDTPADGIIDLHNYLFNHAGMYPFDNTDFYLPEEDTYAKGILEITEGYKDIIAASSKGCLYSFFSMTNDGSIVFGDGFGSEIRLSKGSIKISAPKTILIEAGASIVEWASQTVSIKGKKQVEIVSTDEDVKIKAEDDLMLTSSWKDIILDDRSGNIYVRAPEGKVSARGGLVELYGYRAPWPGGGSEEEDEGEYGIYIGDTHSCIRLVDGCLGMVAENKLCLATGRTLTLCDYDEPPAEQPPPLITHIICSNEHTRLRVDTICEASLIPKEILAFPEQIKRWQVPEETKLDAYNEDKWDQLFAWPSPEEILEGVTVTEDVCYAAHYPCREVAPRVFAITTPETEALEGLYLSVPRWAYMEYDHVEKWEENPIAPADLVTALDDLASWDYPFPGKIYWIEDNNYHSYGHNLTKDIIFGVSENRIPPGFCAFGSYTDVTPDGNYPCKLA